jgi:hypothetical protein
MNRGTPSRMRSILVLAIAACSSSGPKDPAFTPAGPKPCEKMADHVVGVMQPRDPETGKPVDPNQETADAITRVLIERCTKDAWTQDAQKCFLAIQTIAESDKCAPLLTVDQRNKADEAMGAALGPKPSEGSGSAAP